MFQSSTEVVGYRMVLGKSGTCSLQGLVNEMGVLEQSTSWSSLCSSRLCFRVSLLVLSVLYPAVFQILTEIVGEIGRFGGYSLTCSFQGPMDVINHGIF